MITIKRYPNRKLYNTESKKYITLDGIAALIREGRDVQVVDHGSGENLTALTLSQILFEREKKSVAGFLPHAVLTGLVKAGGDTLSSLRRTIASPLHLLPENELDEEINRRINRLVAAGELAEDEAMVWRDKLLGMGEDEPVAEPETAPQKWDLPTLLARYGIPNREDITRLEAQLKTLAKSIEQLNES